MWRRTPGPGRLRTSPVCLYRSCLNIVKTPNPLPEPCEIELKLALPVSDPSGLAQRVSRTPLLARRKSTRTLLHNTYYDTPDQLLRQQGVALRVRREGRAGKPQWLQTLKTAGASGSALSIRGEWEFAIPSGDLSLEILRANTPWARIDPDARIFAALGPCFVTHFERTAWLVRRRDASAVEVALDLGQIEAGDKSAPLCELELELLQGEPQALFEIAQQIAGKIPLLPLGQSKSERGYALAKGTLDAPVRAAPARLRARMPVADAAHRVLREMFHQFTANLHALRVSDDPEVVHQARVGWRRFRSAWRLFRPALDSGSTPDWDTLKPLMAFVGELRDLDVARTETLPPFTEAYTAGDPRRTQDWQALFEALAAAATLQRKSVRYALEDPALGATLLQTVFWLERLPRQPADNAPDASTPPLRQWAVRRVGRMHQQLESALEDDADSIPSQHRIRIQAKRLRYAIEALRGVLPDKRSNRWLSQACGLQAAIGDSRDLVQAGVLAARVEADRGVVEFLRGLAAGRQRRP